jgi:hypothetical protein
MEEAFEVVYLQLLPSSKRMPSQDDFNYLADEITNYEETAGIFYNLQGRAARRFYVD